MFVDCWPPPEGHRSHRGIKALDFNQSMRAMLLLSLPPLVICVVMLVFDASILHSVGSKYGASEIRQNSWPIPNRKLPALGGTHARDFLARIRI